MLTVSNVLTLLRVPFALAFLVNSTYVRVLAIVLAMLTDYLDGFIARRSGATSQLGAFLGPLVDKFFVLFVGCVLISEGTLAAWQLPALMARDFFLLLFAGYLLFSGHWKQHTWRSIWWGKVSTVVQCLALIALALKIHLHWGVYLGFIALGMLVFLELLQQAKSEVRG